MFLSSAWYVLFLQLNIACARKTEERNMFVSITGQSLRSLLRMVAWWNDRWWKGTKTLGTRVEMYNTPTQRSNGARVRSSPQNFRLTKS